MQTERVCIGGHLHGTLKSDNFSCLAPLGYNLTTISDGVESYEFWTHASIDKETDRRDAILRYASEHQQRPDEVEGVC